MSLVRHMKAEMMLRQRKNRKAALSIEEQMEVLDLPDSDRREVRQFQELLRDMGRHMPVTQIIEKHGAEYFGGAEQAASLAEKKG